MNKINIKTLQDAIEYGIVNLDSVQNELMAKKIEQVKKMHPNKITPPKTEGGRWQTYIKNEQGKRVCIKAQSEEALIEKLASIYLSKSYIDKMTFHDLYDEWLDYKTGITTNPNTILRHKQHYKKYLTTSVLDKKRVLSIDDLLLETECNRIVRDFNLSSNEWTNLKTIIKGMFEYATRKHYLTVNPFLNVSIRVKFRQVVRKSGRTETYNTEELQILNDYLEKMYSETNDASFLAVRINFYLGLRVGELVTLKWGDLLEDKKLHVVREEFRDQTTNTVSVVEHTKTNTDRFVIVVPNAYELFFKLAQIENTDIPLLDFCTEHAEDYIFQRDGKRLEARQINYVLEKFAQRTGVKVKSSHKIRKTYASNLNAAGVPLDCIREQLGHTNLTTTMQYIFNPLTETQTYELLTKAL